MLLRRLAAATCTAVAISISVPAQTPAPEGAASISGRVTLQGRPYANAQVLLMSQPKDGDNILQGMTGARAPQKAATDSDGHYRFTNLAAGPYEVSVHAPALIGSGRTDAIIVADGEAVEAINFALTPGGVITGSVTLADGRPAINKTISVEPAAEDKNAPSFASAKVGAMLSQKLSFDMNTDDRGVFRIYGVEAGDYLVSVHSGGGHREDAVTYYPGVTDKTKAVPIKVKAGSEATGIDVKLSTSKKGFEVRGRVVDESGNGVAGTIVICQPVRDEAADTVGFSGYSGEAHSNSKGEFKFEGVRPGKYTASAITMFDESNLYGDVATFEVTNSDAGGVEIKTHKGLTASGIAVIEGNDDPSVSAQLPQVQLMGVVMAAAESVGGFGMSKGTVAPDGTFTITGLRPGKVTIMTSPMVDSSFALLRTERGGVPQNGGIDITADTPVTDIKLVLGYRNCSIYGHVGLSGGTIPKGSGLNVLIRRIGSETEEMFSDVHMHSSDRTISTAMGISSGTTSGFTVSPGGDFRADRLVAGDYEVTVTAGTGTGETKSSSQKVTLASGAQLELNLTLDLASAK